VAVVTGGASGIGLALARGLGQRGLSVVVADVQEDAAEKAVAALAADGMDVAAAATDVSDPAAVDRLADLTLARFGSVDVICNNAGVVGPQLPSWEQDVRIWRWVIDVTLMGVIHGIRSFVPHLVRQGSGHVLNTASVGGLMPLPTLGPYNAAKHAVVGLTETLRAEFEMFAPGLGATVLCPGMVATALSETSLANAPPDVPLDRSAPRPSVEETAERYGSVLTADEVALAAIAGIEEDRAHVLPSPDSGPPVRARVDALLADLPAGVDQDRDTERRQP
jgi:NAD(P)-dependent dehydrogenase (short-subunit alcohol dehydrogenase family)